MTKKTIMQVASEMDADTYAEKDFFLLLEKGSDNAAVQTLRIDGEKVHAIRLNREQFNVHGVRLRKAIFDLWQTHGAYALMG